MMKSPLFLARVLVLAVVAGATALTGCSGEVSFTTAKLSDATMCLGVDAEMKPVNPTDTFGVNTPEIFCSMKLSNAPDETEILSEWIYVKGEAEGVEDYTIDSVGVTTDGTRYLYFSLPRPDAGWPVGEYLLNLYVDGKKQESVSFDVSRSAVSTSGAMLSEATMALGVDAMSRPVDPTGVFSSDTPEIYCSVLVSNAPAGTQILSEWYYVSGEWQGASNVLVGEVPLVLEGTRYASLSLIIPDEGWPAGQYQVKLYLNGALQEAVPFSVEAAALSAVMAMNVDADNQPVNQTTTFPAGTDKVWTIISAREVPAGAKLLVEWYETGGQVDTFINKYESTIEPRDKPYTVYVTRGTGGWPAGEYATVISINGQRQIVLPFIVQ